MADLPDTPLSGILRDLLAPTDRLPLLSEAIELDRAFATRRPEATLLVWHSDTALATVAAQRLVDFDRELRRATALATGSPKETRPTRIGSGGLVISDAAPGSLDLVLTALGLTGMVLMSQPVQLLLTVQALLEDVAHLRSWLHRRGSHAAIGELRAEIAALRAEATGRTGAPEAVIEGGRIEVRGRTHLTLVRRYSDGTTDYVEFDGRG